MRKTLTYPLLGLTLFLLCWINLPSLLSDRLRNFISHPFGKRAFEKRFDEVARLELENRTLHTQLDQAYEWLLFDKRLTDRTLIQKRADLLKTRLSEQLFSMPAQVIYRDPSLWSSSLWVNVGEKTNALLGKKVIAKNSPVLSDGALIGVVEFVGEKQSRVRLITDSGLSPSVRVCRGKVQNRELVHQLDSLFKLIEKRDDLEKEELLRQILSLKEKLGSEWDDGYLAKGELHGSSSAFWRSRSPMLKGIGFNFDFPDELSSENKQAPILKEGDLLVTTGLDGVFPQGLFVGTVAKIYDRQPGFHSYEIDVRPIVSHLNDLQILFIIPPVGD